MYLPGFACIEDWYVCVCIACMRVYCTYWRVFALVCIEVYVLVLFALHVFLGIVSIDVYSQYWCVLDVSHVLHALYIACIHLYLDLCV